MPRRELHPGVFVARHLDDDVREPRGARRGGTIRAIEHHEPGPSVRAVVERRHDGRIAEHGLFAQPLDQRLQALRIVALVRNERIDRNETQVGQAKIIGAGGAHGSGSYTIERTRSRWGAFRTRRRNTSPT